MASRTPSLRTALYSSRLLPRPTISPFKRLASSSQQPDRPDLNPSERDKSRHDIVVDNQENVKSGFDSWASDAEGTAFSRENLGPEEHRKRAGKESEEMRKGSNPLDVSPANQEVSQVRDALKEGLGTDSPNSSNQSKGGSPMKGAAGKKYEKESEMKGEGSNQGTRPQQVGREPTVSTWGNR